MQPVGRGPTVDLLAIFRGPRAVWFYKVFVGRKLAANDALRVKQSNSFSPGGPWIHRPVSSVVKRTPSVGEVWVRFPSWSNRQSVANSSPLL